MSGGRTELPAGPEGAEGLRWLWAACEPIWTEALAHARALGAKAAEREDLISDAGVVASQSSALDLVGLALRGEDRKAVREDLERCAEGWCVAGDSVARWRELTSALRGRLLGAVVARYASDPQRLASALGELDAVVSAADDAVIAAYLTCKEHQLSLQRSDAEQATMRFRRLSESGIIGIFVCDLFGRAKEANDAFLNIVGYTREEMMSGRLNWVEMTPPEWRHLDAEAIEQLQRSGRTRAWEKEYVRKGGARVPVLVGVAMLNDTDCVAFVLDISERKRLEQEREKSRKLELQNARIQEASRLKSEFLANMSHELRTPLNSIIGFADLLYDREVDPSSAQYLDFVGDIRKSGKHLLQLINDVLDLAKVESGKMEFWPEPLQLEAVLSEVVTMMRTTAAQKRLRIDLIVGAEVQTVVLDPSRLKQVLYNYLSNAIKFTPEAGNIQVRAAGEGEDRVRIEVIDSGVGITEGDLARLFVEFQQLDAGSAKRHAGTGLGLALTKRIVEAQGGSVGVESKLGAGSRFYAVLPRMSDSTTEAPSSAREHQVKEVGSQILVVEDDPRDRRLIVTTLNDAGYAVETAATAGEAISTCDSRSFDAITLDILLPDQTGIDVLRHIRAGRTNRETPVIIVSVVAEKGVLGGFPVHDYLQKPLSASALVASLERAGVRSQSRGPILVVDDDGSALRLMDATLRGFGYSVVCSEDGEQALRRAREYRPEAVILDLLMPGVDGFEFLHRFRSDPEHRTVPVIVWTTKDITAEDRAKLDRAAQAVFAKEGQLSSLVDELRGLLSQQGAPDARGAAHG